jgi:hypothetical protein
MIKAILFLVLFLSLGAYAQVPEPDNDYPRLWTLDFQPDIELGSTYRAGSNYVWGAKWRIAGRYDLAWWRPGYGTGYAPGGSGTILTQTLALPFTNAAGNTYESGDRKIVAAGDTRYYCVRAERDNTTGTPAYTWLDPEEYALENLNQKTGDNPPNDWDPARPDALGYFLLWEFITNDVDGDAGDHDVRLQYYLANCHPDYEQTEPVSGDTSTEFFTNQFINEQMDTDNADFQNWTGACNDLMNGAYGSYAVPSGFNMEQMAGGNYEPYSDWDENGNEDYDNDDDGDDYTEDPGYGGHGDEEIQAVADAGAGKSKFVRNSGTWDASFAAGGSGATNVFVSGFLGAAEVNNGTWAVDSVSSDELIVLDAGDTIVDSTSSTWHLIDDPDGTDFSAVNCLWNMYEWMWDDWRSEFITNTTNEPIIGINAGSFPDRLHDHDVLNTMVIEGFVLSSGAVGLYSDLQDWINDSGNDIDRKFLLFEYYARPDFIFNGLVDNMAWWPEKRGEASLNHMRFGLTFCCAIGAYLDYQAGWNHELAEWYDEYEINLGDADPDDAGGPNMCSILDKGFDAYGDDSTEPSGGDVLVRFFDNGCTICWLGTNSGVSSVKITDADLHTAWSDAAGANLAGSPPDYYFFQGGQDPVLNNGQLFDEVEFWAFQGSKYNFQDTDWVNGEVIGEINYNNSNNIQSGDGVVLVTAESVYIADNVVGNGLCLDTSPTSSGASYSETGTSGMVDIRVQTPTTKDLDYENPYYTNLTWASYPNSNVHFYDYGHVQMDKDTANVATYEPTLGVTGYYEVYEWHGFHGKDNTGGGDQPEASDVPWKIFKDTGSGWVEILSGTIDQTIDYGQWNPISTYGFDYGVGDRVKFVMYSLGAEQDVIADAIKFRYAGMEYSADHGGGGGYIASVPYQAQDGLKISVLTSEIRNSERDYAILDLSDGSYVLVLVCNYEDAPFSWRIQYRFSAQGEDSQPWQDLLYTSRLSWDPNRPEYWDYNSPYVWQYYKVLGAWGNEDQIHGCYSNESRVFLYNDAPRWGVWKSIMKDFSWKPGVGPGVSGGADAGERLVELWDDDSGVCMVPHRQWADDNTPWVQDPFGLDNYWIEFRLIETDNNQSFTNPDGEYTMLGFSNTALLKVVP